jgi:hypothetical protein
MGGRRSAQGRTLLDQGISPLVQSSDFALLNWNGIAMVEEDWRTPDGVTFTRQRFYRGANWMTQPSTFALSLFNLQLSLIFHGG